MLRGRLGRHVANRLPILYIHPGRTVISNEQITRALFPSGVASQGWVEDGECKKSDGGRLGGEYFRTNESNSSHQQWLDALSLLLLLQDFTALMQMKTKTNHGDLPGEVPEYRAMQDAFMRAMMVCTGMHNLVTYSSG